MATLASTQVTASSFAGPLPFGGLNVELYRVAGGAVGDTATIAPSRGRYVLGCLSTGTASTTLSTAGTATNVVLTLLASAATDVTFDALLFVQP